MGKPEQREHGQSIAPLGEVDDSEVWGHSGFRLARTFCTLREHFSAHGGSLRRELDQHGALGSPAWEQMSGEPMA